MKRGLTSVIIVLAAILLIISVSCGREQEQVLYQCKDGTLVEDFNDCPEFQEAEEEEELPEEPQNQTQIPEDIIEPGPSDEIKRDVYKKEDEKNLSATSYPSLNGWAVMEIVNGMAAYNPELRGKYPIGVEYNKYTPGYYTKGASSNKIKDPFYIMRRHTSGSAREFSVYNFRVEVPVRPYGLYDEVVSKHNDSKFKLVYPAEWEEWMKINCEKIESCRDIEAIRCWNNEGDEMYAWVHATPGEGYTEHIKYTMEAVNDDKMVLETFEEFYCSPI